LWDGREERQGGVKLVGKGKNQEKKRIKAEMAWTV